MNDPATFDCLGAIETLWFFYVIQLLLVGLAFYMIQNTRYRLEEIVIEIPEAEIPVENDVYHGD